MMMKKRREKSINLNLPFFIWRSFSGRRLLYCCCCTSIYHPARKPLDIHTRCHFSIQTVVYFPGSVVPDAALANIYAPAIEQYLLCIIPGIYQIPRGYLVPGWHFDSMLMFDTWYAINSVRWMYLGFDLGLQQVSLRVWCSV